MHAFWLCTIYMGVEELAVSIVVVEECWFDRVQSKQDMDRRCRAQVAVNSVRFLVV